SRSGVLHVSRFSRRGPEQRTARQGIASHAAGVRTFILSTVQSLTRFTGLRWRVAQVSADQYRTVLVSLTSSRSGVPHVSRFSRRGPEQRTARHSIASHAAGVRTFILSTVQSLARTGAASPYR